jgi:hypothetical protein
VSYYTLVVLVDKPAQLCQALGTRGHNAAAEVVNAGSDLQQRVVQPLAVRFGRDRLPAALEPENGRKGFDSSQRKARK